MDSLFKPHPAVMAIIMFCVLSSTPSRADETAVLRPDTHAPAGVMVDHMHGAGEFMLGYRLMYSRSDGPTLFGSDEASDHQLADAGYAMTPWRMTMAMHMLDIMYAPADWLTLMVMPQWVDMTMAMREIEGAEDHAGHGGGGHDDHGDHHGAHEHGTHGLGDTSLAALVRIYRHGTHHAHLGLAMSAPTGSVDEKGSDGVFTHYMMQLGSGTWDFLPSLTYTGRGDAWSWGAQASGIIRTEDKNDSGFRFGDQLQATAWVSRSLIDALSASARLVYTSQGTIKGHYNGAHNHTSPPDLQPNYGGEFWEIGLGLNAAVIDGPLAGHRLSTELVVPVDQNVNGYQLERDTTLFVTWSRAF